MAFYYFSDDEGKPYNIIGAACFGEPVRPVLDLPGSVPERINCYDDPEDAEYVLASTRDRYLEKAEDFDRLHVEKLTQEVVDSGNFEPVKVQL